MIEVIIRGKKRIKKEFFQKIAQLILSGENKKNYSLNIILLGEERMRKLNAKFRRKKQVTDVLAFPKDQKKKIIPVPEIEEEKRSLGEIVLCPQKIKKNAQKLNSPFKKELANCLIHGILHLLNYNHKSLKQRKEMRKKEEFYLSKIKLNIL